MYFNGMAIVRILLMICLLSIISVLGCAQSGEFEPDQFIDFKDGRYMYKNRLYTNYKKLGPLFQNHKGFSYWHKKAMKRQNTAIVSASMFVIGSTFSILTKDACSGEFGCSAALLIWSGTFITGALTIYELIIIQKAKNKSFQALHDNPEFSYTSAPPRLSISLNLSLYGMGIICRF